MFFVNFQSFSYLEYFINLKLPTLYSLNDCVNYICFYYLASIKYATNLIEIYVNIISITSNHKDNNVYERL